MSRETSRFPLRAAFAVARKRRDCRQHLRFVQAFLKEFFTPRIQASADRKFEARASSTLPCACSAMLEDGLALLDERR
ncbi:hypothetical protein, partial [Burkholderia mallei]|uniref:hypothetical protein n=1 Tax=Burkholderia mallei TaxID=13373 RepID=UPI001E346462